MRVFTITSLVIFLVLFFVNILTANGRAETGHEFAAAESVILAQSVAVVNVPADYSAKEEISNMIDKSMGSEKAAEAMSLWNQITWWGWHIFLLLGFLAAVDPTNKINGLLKKIGPVFNKFAPLDKNKK